MFAGSIYDRYIIGNTQLNDGSTAPEHNQCKPVRVDHFQSACITATTSRLLLAFSVFTNTRKIMSTQTKPDDVTVIHSMRFLSMAWIILSHTYYYCAMSFSMGG
jgi:hypothetical protein